MLKVLLYSLKLQDIVIQQILNQQILTLIPREEDRMKTTVSMSEKITRQDINGNYVSNEFMVSSTLGSNETFDRVRFRYDIALQQFESKYGILSGFLKERLIDKPEFDRQLKPYETILKAWKAKLPKEQQDAESTQP